MVFGIRPTAGSRKFDVFSVHSEYECIDVAEAISAIVLVPVLLHWMAGGLAPGMTHFFFGPSGMAKPIETIHGRSRGAVNAYCVRADMSQRCS